MLTRTPIIAGNWKLNGSVGQTRSLIRDIGLGITGFQSVEVVVCPPFVYLSEASNETDAPGRGDIKLGAQDVSQHSGGAYTGEVSACMLKEFHCAYAIVGHSERRQYYGENDLLVARKALAAQTRDITPIVCVSETLQQRQEDKAREVIENQLAAIVDGTDGIDLTNIVVAYEPVWAIGTGNVASSDQVQEVHEWIREKFYVASSHAAENCRILYGGSVNADNADSIIALQDVDGCLVGGASLRSDEFIRICQVAETEGKN